MALRGRGSSALGCFMSRLRERFPRFTCWCRKLNPSSSLFVCYTPDMFFLFQRDAMSTYRFSRQHRGATEAKRGHKKEERRKQETEPQAREYPRQQPNSPESPPQPHPGVRASRAAPWGLLFASLCFYPRPDSESPLFVHSLHPPPLPTGAV